MAFKARLNFSGKGYNAIHCARMLNREEHSKRKALFFLAAHFIQYRESISVSDNIYTSFNLLVPDSSLKVVNVQGEKDWPQP
ncbi:hypothetical protein [Pedobacter nototheniae]|uniref:hypothetical protein n=1 Tax=Pedobacter nototheniae TaxID=2488994 RepID=UPI0029301643|nr:hypothetical protein [Pedobacter nototheniae]